MRHTTAPTRALAELQAWYLGGLQPKVAAAARAGTVEPAAAAALDRLLRNFLELDGEPDSESA